jgi:hypothetical protein
MHDTGEDSNRYVRGGEPEPAAVPGAKDVIRSIMDALDNDLSGPERIVVQKATDHIYAVRVYHTSDDYEGFILYMQDEATHQS